LQTELGSRVLSAASEVLLGLQEHIGCTLEHTKVRTFLINFEEVYTTDAQS
jgi:hypothetical protein